jgi:hypothetical protein
MENVLAELIRLFRVIIYRDIAYVGGGATVLLTFHYISSGALPQATTTPYLLLFVFISYVVGYSVMEIFSILGIVTSSYRRPGRILRWLLHRWDGADWSNMPERNNVPQERIVTFLDDIPVDKRGSLIRITDLMQICITAGSNFLFTAAILLIRSIVFGVSRAQHDMVLGLGMLLLGSTLSVMGNMQATSRIRYMLELSEAKGFIIRKGPTKQ